MLVKNSLHLVLHRIVLAYPVWQGDKSEEIEMLRGEGGSVAGPRSASVSLSVQREGGRKGLLAAEVMPGLQHR